MLLDDMLGFNLVGFKKVINIRSLILILFIIALVFIIIDTTKMYYKCPKNVIEYRYIPRSFNDEQDNPVPIKSIFGKMFDNPSPWVNSFTSADEVVSNRNNNFVRQN